MSPQSTEPSTSRPESRDTPPPGDLNSGDSGTLGARPSRRARPQVSYKEPSLNTKMRRPGKELVDAVIPSHDRRSSVEPASAAKREPDVPNPVWKSVPAEPSRGADDAEARSPLREKLGRNLGEPAQEPLKLNSSAASSAISALISATSSSKRRTSLSASTASGLSPVRAADVANPPAKPPHSKEQEKDPLAVFDITDSAPNDCSASRRRVDLAKIAKSGRRHSALPTSSTAGDRASVPKTATNGSLAPLHSRTGSTASGKSSGTSNLHSRSNSTSMATVREKKTSATSSTDDHADLKASDEVPSSSGLRAERAASRRKSMMI
jgi:hypothetical protein